MVHAGVADAPRCQSLADSFRKAHGGTPPSNAGQLADFLVSKGVLTKFQSEAFLAEQLTELRLGPYLIRDPQVPSPLGRFVAAQQTTDGAIGALLRTGPGNAWLSKHVAIDSPNLQPYSAQVIGDYEAVFSPIGQGKVLTQVLSEPNRNQPWATESIVSLGTNIANAMAAMHDAGIAHGAIRADRIWVRDDGEMILLRDPSGAPMQLTRQDESSSSEGWFETLDDPSLYVAPELAPREANSEWVQPSPTSDLYSLGCLLFRLASGRFPFSGNSPEETQSLHATEIPEELKVAVEQGENGDPLYRVLAYALAKSPQARFSSSKQLAAALVAVGQTLTPVPQPNKPAPDKTSPNKTAIK